jgi:hypothetical protein
MYVYDWRYKQPEDEHIHDVVLLDTLALDYLTLTSYDTVLLEAHARYLISRIPRHEPVTKNRMQYAGLTCDGIFYGVGRQNERLHAILQVPGYRAHVAAVIAQLDTEPLRCSRFDLQITIDASLVPDMDTLFDLLTSAANKDWHQTGPRPKVQHIRNSDGYDTVYVGARSSDLFRRIYVKHIEGKDYVRYEVEYKGQLAKALWERGDVDDRNAQAALFRHQFFALPSSVQRALSPIMDRIEQGSGEFTPVNRSTDAETAIDWFGSAVAPALDKALVRGYFAEVCAIMAGRGYDVSVRDEQARLSAAKRKEG